MGTAAKNAWTSPAPLAMAALVTFLWMTPTRGEEEFSPRGFCTQRGGAVLETGDPDIHICCYSQPPRCVAVNSRNLTSVPWIFPDELSDTRPERQLGQVE